MSPSIRLVGHSRSLGWLGIATATLLLAACSEGNQYIPPPPPAVLVSTPIKQDVTNYLYFTGNTAAINSVDLVARVEGFLASIDYKDGSPVKKGDRLFLIQQDTYQANLDQAKASLASAEAQLTNTSAEYQRQQTLGQQDFSSQAVVDKALAAKEQAQAAVDSAKADIELATINLGYTTVIAPFDGVVTRHLADVGQLVGHGEPTTLATIVQMNPIYTYFSFSENQVLAIKQVLASQGRTLEQVHQVEVDIGLQNEGADFPYKGRLDYVSPEIDPATGTLLVRALFENDKLALLPGLFVRVRIPTQTTPAALLVDDTAVGEAQQGRYVLVVNKDDVVEQKVITTGQRVGPYRVVETGLTAEDRIVVGGIQRAVPGSKVDPQQAPPADPANASNSDAAKAGDAKADDTKTADTKAPDAGAATGTSGTGK